MERSSQRVTVEPSQIGHMDFLDLDSALQRLPAEQREALFLVAASGMSYEEAAEICDCAIGTIKSSRQQGALAADEADVPVSGDREHGAWPADGEVRFRIVTAHIETTFTRRSDASSR